MVSFRTSEGSSCLGDILVPERREFPSLCEALIVCLYIYLGRWASTQSGKYDSRCLLKFVRYVVKMLQYYFKFK